ncbi:MAG TPA: methionyl-tRNA formyltransferase [Planctomycetota bacterium]|nr:methionyl-tRNA formyltransferase [Planctomycetota bacterium]
MKVAFFGTPQFAVPSLRALPGAGHQVALVVTNPDRPQGRSRALVAPPVKEVALELGFPVHQPETVKGDSRLEHLRDEGVELGVVVAYGQFLPKLVRESPSRGFMVNVHASLLPRWRGAAPIPAAIRAGDKVSGVSVQRIEKELDGGPVLGSRQVALTGTETRGSLEESLSVLGAELLVECLRRIETGEAVFTPQDAAQATHVGKIEVEDARLDLAQSAASLERLVRAVHPEPIAWLDLPSGRLQVLRSHVEGPARHAAGEVEALAKDALLVATGEGALALDLVKPAGKREMTGAAWANGKRLKPGMKLA